jgi:hypothetical protein
MPNAMRVSEVRVSQREPEREFRIFTFKATELIWTMFGALEVLIALRVALKLIAASPGSPIVALIYAFTDLFLSPFVGMVTSLTANGIELELSSLFAMVVYALIGWLLERFVTILFYRPRGPAVATTQTTTTEHTDSRPTARS